MELADLHIFKTVVEEGGILKASRRLHRVQSSVSARIRQLEAAVGAQLFYRDKQRLALTPGGELLLGYANRLLTLSAEARAALAGSPPRGLLKLGALESTAASRLPPILARYHRAYADVRVELITGTNDALTAAVAERRLDAAFVAQAPADPVLCSLDLFAERLVVVSARDHPRIVRASDIQHDTLVSFPRGCAYRRILERWIGSRRLATMRVLEVASYHAIVACVAAGAGVALAPESVLAALHQEQVARHPLPKIHGRITTPLIWRADNQSAALAALQAQLRDHPEP